MSLSALIKFTQGALTDAAGRAVEAGVTGVACVCSNGDDTSVHTWEWKLLDKPRLSGLSLGVFSTTATGSFTPDVDGQCYRVQLTAKDITGTIIARDVRNFGVPDAAGILLPSFEPDPSVPDYTKDEFNFSGQARSWSYLLEKSVAAIKVLVGSATDLVLASQASGDITRFNGTHWVVVHVGTTGQLLQVVGGQPTWVTYTPTNLNLTSQATGSLTYYSGSAWVQLGIGTTGQVLTVAGGIPSWATPAAGGGVDTIVDPGADTDVGAITATTNTTFPIHGYTVSHSATLPASPTAGVTYTFPDMDGSIDAMGTKVFTVHRNGMLIDGAASDFVLDGSVYLPAPGTKLCLVMRFISNSLGWKVVN